MTKEPTTECSFPELLARDLELSAPVFITRSMLDGCPSPSFSTASIDDGISIEGLDIPRRPAFYQHDTARRLSVASNDQTTMIDMFSNDESQLGEFSDTESESSVGMEQPAARTREQSFTTAATSVSGRCSSLISHKPPSPSRISSQYGVRKGSWFDTDEDIELPSTPERQPMDRPVAPCPLSALGFNSLHRRDSSPLSASTTLRPSTSATYHPSHGMTTVDRPHTSSGPARMERPRIVEIQPPLVVPNRKSSLKTQHRPSPTWMTPQTTAYNQVSHDDGTLKCLQAPLRSSPIMPVLATACGRTVIDASKPPVLASREQPRDITDGRTSYLDIADDFIFDAGSESRGYVVPPGHDRKGSLVTLSSWAGSAAEIVAPRTSMGASTTQGIPLPPEVVESLRISISCFPDTMLLSSSLSIETIRSYSKKLKHGALPVTNRMSEDDRSVFSFTTCSTKSTSRWGFHRFLQGRSMKQGNEYPRSHGSAPEQVVTEIQAPVAPAWTPIKNIFPTASDYLCDALYAHIVAYNYIHALCPAAPVLPTQTSAGGNEKTQKIPKKAASLLGLQETPSPTGYGHMQTSFPVKFIGGRRPGTPHSRRTAVSEATALQNIQAGLGRCIALLVATLKQAGEDTEERDGVITLLQPEADMMDPLLMRAICEAVRCAEEAIC
ncbi:hypothetical protein QBC47DRAFT_399616 [Echria macrotheca]|uniref:Uncharacterized protein n=1 Tax=Echria macrotheca TaxID=438768 RepID=A0AAJ0BIS8_9PEZI|nr:hypothetical protein QBC47DRAFT_399616 [Echria macrotheca]